MALTRDHPRVCGEKRYSIQRIGKGTGSPPRMRGKVSQRELKADRDRITPAYAGKRFISASNTLYSRDHPRVCGEKRNQKGRSSASSGSPPRMRGKVGCAGLHHLIHGITPAYAGKSLKKLRKKYNIRDHPRVCGEKYFIAPILHLGAGSPPRMRGKDVGGHSFAMEAGITPAYAGKSITVVILFLAHGDHPRVCGEKHFGQGSGLELVGSPPRMRGKGCQWWCRRSVPGITPAYAGKSGCHRGRQRSCWDHPRVCGEKSYPLSDIGRRLGSPPRMRGKVRCWIPH